MEIQHSQKKKKKKKKRRVLWQGSAGVHPAEISSQKGCLQLYNKKNQGVDFCSWSWYLPFPLLNIRVLDRNLSGYYLELVGVFLPFFEFPPLAGLPEQDPLLKSPANHGTIMTQAASSLWHPCPSHPGTSLSLGFQPHTGQVSHHHHLTGAHGGSGFQMSTYHLNVYVLFFVWRHRGCTIQTC